MFSIYETLDPDGTVRLALTGELDLESVDSLAERLRDLAGNDRALLLDLAQLEFIDSSGLQVLIEAAGAARRDGRKLALTQPPEVIRRAFMLFGLFDALPFEKP